jgi:hypothetical protein
MSSRSALPIIVAAELRLPLPIAATLPVFRVLTPAVLVSATLGRLPDRAALRLDLERTGVFRLVGLLLIGEISPPRFELI